MNENFENEEKLPGQDLESRDRLQTLLQSKQDSTYSLSQYLLLSILPLAYFLFTGFLESIPLLPRMLARSVLILYLLVLIVYYFITKKRDILYMIIAFIIVFPILVFLAYFDQMITLLTLSVLGFLPWIQIQRRKYPFSSRKESKKNIQTLLHTKQYSLYSLFQHLLLPTWALSLFLFIGFYEKYELLTRMLARSALILYLLVLIVYYLITKKRDVLYMIIAFIIEFPILVFLAYFNQMIALFTLAVIGFFTQMYVRKNPNRSSSLKESKKISHANKSQDKFSIENNS